MKKLLLFATAYPYTAGIIAVTWLGSVVLLKIDPYLPSQMVLFVDVVVTALFASIGFRR